MSAPADPLSAEERALLDDVAQGPVRLYVRTRDGKTAYWYAWAAPIAGLAHRGHKGQMIFALGLRGYIQTGDDCASFEISEAGRAALADLQKGAAVPAAGVGQTA